MKVCSHCKTQNNVSANFCKQCGFVFPDINLKAGNIDNSLINKVNELQRRVNEAETNSKNAQREINILNSRISTIDKSNTILQKDLTRTKRQLSEANNNINSERQKTQNALKEVDEVKKSLEEAESSKNKLNKLYFILLIIISCFAITKCNSNIQKENEITSIKNKRSELLSQVKKLKEENGKLTTSKNSLLVTLGNVSKNNPLIINDISIRSDNGSSKSSISRYAKSLNSRLSIFSLTSGPIHIKEKFLYPWGTSYSDNTVHVSKNENTTFECSSWYTDGTWQPGTYRFEYYYNGKLIGLKSFKIN